jgi:ABC-2 type transport system permease protein
MNIRRIRTVIVKELKEVSKSRQAVGSMIIMPLFLILFLPFISVFSVSSIPDDQISSESSLQRLIDNFPQDAFPSDLTPKQKYIYIMLIYFFAPFFLVIPVMISSVVAANSFAGEKERKTLEGLLYTPVTDDELILAKILVSLICAISVSWFCFLVYTGIVNGIGLQYFDGRLIFPTPTWLLLVFWLVPTTSFFAMSIIIAISQRVSTVWEAQQIAAIIVVPIIALVVSQATGFMILSQNLIIIAGCVALLADYVFFKWIKKTFNREGMVTKLT